MKLSEKELFEALLEGHLLLERDDDYACDGPKFSLIRMKDDGKIWNIADEENPIEWCIDTERDYIYANHDCLVKYKNLNQRLDEIYQKWGTSYARNEIMWSEYKIRTGRNE